MRPDPTLADNDDPSTMRAELLSAEHEVERAAAEIAAMRARLAAAQEELTKACEKARALRAKKTLLDYWREHPGS